MTIGITVSVMVIISSIISFTSIIIMSNTLLINISNIDYIYVCILTDVNNINRCILKTEPTY